MHPLFKFFQLTFNTPQPSNGNWNLLVAKKGVLGVCYHFGKITFASPFGQLKNFSCCGCVQWQVKFFGCHSTMGVCWITTNFFNHHPINPFVWWRPIFFKRMELASFLCRSKFFDCHGHYVEGDQIFSIAI